MTTSFHRNPAVHAEIKAQPSAVAALEEQAAEVARTAKLLAPRHTGHYARSITRIGTSVGTTDIAGHIVEWGSANNPPYAVLRRAVLAVGLRLDERQL